VSMIGWSARQARRGTAHTASHCQSASVQSAVSTAWRAFVGGLRVRVRVREAWCHVRPSFDPRTPNCVGGQSAERLSMCVFVVVVCDAAW